MPIRNRVKLVPAWLTGALPDTRRGFYDTGTGDFLQSVLWLRV